jgi:predicted DNA-binding transcriptional regulator AlpA
MAESGPVYLSDAEVALRLGVSRGTVWRWRKTEPDFPRPYKLGGVTRWKLSDLQTWEVGCQLRLMSVFPWPISDWTLRSA